MLCIMTFLFTSRIRDSISWFVEKLRLRDAKEGANLMFLVPYYKHSGLHDKQRVKMCSTREKHRGAEEDVSRSWMRSNGNGSRETVVY